MSGSSFGSEKSSGSLSESESSSVMSSSSGGSFGGGSLSGGSSGESSGSLGESDSYPMMSSLGGDSLGGGSSSGGSSSGDSSSAGCPPMPSNVTIEISDGEGVPADTTESWSVVRIGIIPVAPWDAADYAACWTPIGTLQPGAWADNSGSIGGSAVADYDHGLALAGEPQTGTAEEQSCTVTLEESEGILLLLIDYEVTNGPDEGPDNPSSITGTVEVTWERV